MKKFFTWMAGIVAIPFVTLLIAVVGVKLFGFSIETASFFIGDSDDLELILGVWGVLTALSFFGWTGSFLDLSDEKKAPQFRSGSSISCDFCGGRSDKPFYHDGGSRDICADCIAKASSK